eukprot:COSAG01_NODE_21978_length_877_cov_1.116967_1_plen_41_part_10
MMIARAIETKRTKINKKTKKQLIRCGDGAGLTETDKPRVVT